MIFAKYFFCVMSIYTQDSAYCRSPMSFENMGKCIEFAQKMEPHLAERNRVSILVDGTKNTQFCRAIK